MKIDVCVSSAIPKSPRVAQVASMFDVPPSEKASRRFTLTAPIDDAPWSVGLITGPSGSGKSTVANHLWPAQLSAAPSWSDEPIVNDFPDAMGIRDITDLLSSVGLASPPAWLRPRSTLSNGEGFRADVARLLADTEAGGITVVDEWSSVVDRHVAQVASHTVQKTVRRQGRQLVAVTCHYDVEDWLQPDWVIDMADQSFRRRQVQPHPRLTLDIHKTGRALWPVFAPHHYLSADLSKAAQCYAAHIDGRPVAFASYVHFPHAKTRDLKMAHRIVALPDYQGLGIGMRLAEWLGGKLWNEGYRFRIMSSHPAVHAACARSKRWRATSKPKTRLSSGRNAGQRARNLDVRKFSTRSFQYTPPAGGDHT